ncbi:hypothetical protein G6F37_011126 [Rhizopus arrhizus]|nr:hypothetical protein G6F38_011205 [Rhizopus arrhizus]KAG1150772.1 hypothetical protein G6F37_011126 [Rhizopus arrhizus]
MKANNMLRHQVFRTFHRSKSHVNSDQSIVAPGLQVASGLQGTGPEDMDMDETPSTTPEMKESTQEKQNAVSSAPSVVASATSQSTKWPSESTLRRSSRSNKGTFTSTNYEIQQTLDILLQTKSSCWSSHCGVVSLNANIIITPILVSIDQLVILSHVKHDKQLFEPFHIITTYAPANPQERRFFFADLASFSPIVSLFENPSAPIVVTGDFNYSHSTFTGVPQSWRDIISKNFHDCLSQSSALSQQPTFSRGNSLSIIDYIFGSYSLYLQVHSSSVEFINNEWTDHALVSVCFKFTSSRQGLGLWRLNPNFLKSKKFLHRLSSTVETFMRSIDIDTTNPQDVWDRLKIPIKQVAKTFGRRQAHWRQSQLARLQKKRNRILRQYKVSGVLNHLLPSIELQIGSLQQAIAVNNILRTGRHWREQGEISAGFLKRTIASRATSRYIPYLKDDNQESPSSGPLAMQSTARSFYQRLYTCEPSSAPATDTILESVPRECVINPSTADSLLDAFEYDDVVTSTKRCPFASSTGKDGLPYELLLALYQFDCVQPLVQRIYNDALQKGAFPSSWSSTCTVLLPKKGDLSSLRNWRPISLINTDVKVFTRLLQSRMIRPSKELICQSQTGFLPEHFIGDNGLFLQLIQTHASLSPAPDIRLMLDQEKAYDRVHPEYLTKVLLRFGFPETLVKTIINLFFGSKIQINVNGFLTIEFTHGRGLRQGDPLSPLLFNLAFDPFLRSILQEPSFEGFVFSPPTPNPYCVLPPAPVKVLAYADDVLVFLRSASDFFCLRRLYDTYSAASNARLNISKTEAFSLSGRSSLQWQEFLQEQGVTSWHDSSTPVHVRYLGFVFYSSNSQRDQYLASLVQKIQTACNIHSQRQLSYRGRVTVLNPLIYSKLWYVLRLLPVSIKSANPVLNAHKSWSKVKVSSAYAFDYRSGRLRRRRGQDISEYTGLVKRFFKSLDNHGIWLQEFFLRCCLLSSGNTISHEPGPVDFSPWCYGFQPTELVSVYTSNSQFRQSLHPEITAPRFKHNISSLSWLAFWKADIPLRSRDIWFRLLHGKISCQETLHQVFPSVFTSTICPICHQESDSVIHFIYACPAKLVVWDYSWRKYLKTPFNLSQLEKALFGLTLTTPLSLFNAFEKPSPFQVFACTMLAIWKAHWNQVFDRGLFVYSLVVNDLEKHITTLVTYAD